MAKTTTFFKVVNVNFLREVDKKINLTTKGQIDKYETLEMLMIFHFLLKGRDLDFILVFYWTKRVLCFYENNNARKVA